jgi:tetratricopeptide (TPR) repeat protein
MHRILFVAGFLFFFCSCNNGGSANDTVLSDPSYSQLTDSIRLMPSNADLYFKRGTLLYGNDQMEYAEKDLRQAWTLEPTEEHALRVVTLLKRKNTDSAIVFLQQATKKLPSSIALQIGLARGYQQKGMIDQAVAITDQVIGQYPGQLDALTLKSELLKGKADGQSLAYLEKAYSLAPSDAGLAYDLAFEYADQKNQKVLALTDSLIKSKAPEIEKAYYTRGVYFVNIGKADEAIKNFDAAIGANYNFMDAYLDKGQFYYSQRNYTQAIKTFDLALRIEPASAEFYYWRAKAKQAMGNRDEAKLDYQRAYALDKTLKEAKEAANRL